MRSSCISGAGREAECEAQFRRSRKRADALQGRFEKRTRGIASRNAKFRLCRLWYSGGCWWFLRLDRDDGAPTVAAIAGHTGVGGESTRDRSWKSSASLVSSQLIGSSRDSAMTLRVVFQEPAGCDSSRSKADCRGRHYHCHAERDPLFAQQAGRLHPGIVEFLG